MDLRLLFVYGTLKKGFKYSRLLKGCPFIGEGVLKGVCYTRKGLGYPVLVEGCNDVVGEIYLIPDPGIIKNIDYLEGYNESTNTGLYLRCIGEASLKNTILNVEYYKYAGEITQDFVELESGTPWLGE